MSLKIKVYSDYVCPFCYLTKFPFEESIEGMDVEVEWMPYELRPSPSPMLDPVNDPSKLALWENYIYPRVKQLNIDMKLPNVSPHPYTELAFEGFHYASEKGKGKEYNDRVFRAFYQEERNIGQIGILKKLAGEIGLDGDDFEKTVLNGKYKEFQKQMLKHAYEEADINVVPTFIIGDTVIQGYNTREEFERVIESELKKVRQ